MAKEIPITDKIVIKNQSNYKQGLLQTYLLSVGTPENNPFIRFECYFPEALACLLSFTFRTRFQASRFTCHLDKSGHLSEPMDVLLRMNAHSVGILTPQSLSLKTEKERSAEMEKVLSLLKKANSKNYKILMKSFRLYQLALLTYSLDIGLSYSLLVSAVDTISCRLNKEIEGSNAKFVKFIEDNLPENFWLSFDSRAIEEERYMNNPLERFPESLNLPKMERRSILDYEQERYEKQGAKSLEPLKHILSEPAFNRILESFDKKVELPAEEKEAYEHVIRYWHLYRGDEKLSKAELSMSLKNIYCDVRSAFFHRGESPSHTAIDRYETTKIGYHITNEHKVTYKREIPSFYWFERVAHDCILNYVLTNF